MTTTVFKKTILRRYSKKELDEVIPLVDVGDPEIWSQLNDESFEDRNFTGIFDRSEQYD